MSESEKSDPNWPAWFFGPGGESKIFNKPEDVPKGWADHPDKAKADKKPGKAKADA